MSQEKKAEGALIKGWKKHRVQKPPSADVQGGSGDYNDQKPIKKSKKN